MFLFFGFAFGFLQKKRPTKVGFGFCSVRTAARRRRLNAVEGLSDRDIEFGEEENFVEAEKFAYKVLRPYGICEDVMEVMDHDKATILSQDTSPFWFLVAALRRFVSTGDHTLPVSGQVIPNNRTFSVLLMMLLPIYVCVFFSLNPGSRHDCVYGIVYGVADGIQNQGMVGGLY